MIDFSKQTMAISRTEQKKAQERLCQLAQMMAHLPKKTQKDLPISDFFLDELDALGKISSAAAKNRQAKRAGKVLATEDVASVLDALFLKKLPPAAVQKALAWQNRLNIADDNTLKQFVRQYSACEYNSLYQLLLWIEYAKYISDDALLAQSAQDLTDYIKQMALLSK